MYCDTMDLVGKVRGQGLAPDHGLVHEISGCLFKSVIFHKKQLGPCSHCYSGTVIRHKFVPAQLSRNIGARSH